MASFWPAILSPMLARRIFTPRILGVGTPVLRKEFFWKPYCAHGISTQSLPTVAQPGFWKSLVPKFMRGGRSNHETLAIGKKKGWNPATFFIVIFLLIGSQAIQMISLRRSYDRFSHETEAKLTLLREVINRVQSGEDVDVEGMLGTGNKAKEKEWDEVMRELEQEDAIFQTQKRKRNAVKQVTTDGVHTGGQSSPK